MIYQDMDMSFKFTYIFLVISTQYDNDMCKVTAHSFYFPASIVKKCMSLYSYAHSRHRQPREITKAQYNNKHFEQARKCVVFRLKQMREILKNHSRKNWLALQLDMGAGGWG